MLEVDDAEPRHAERDPGCIVKAAPVRTAMMKRLCHSGQHTRVYRASHVRKRDSAYTAHSTWRRLYFCEGVSGQHRIFTAMTASTGTIRSFFPALDRIHNGQSVAYFDGPGGTQVPRQVVDAMVDYLFHHNANTEWAYPTSAETDAALWGARKSLGDFLNAAPSEIAFGANMTTLTHHVARAIGRQLDAGDEIVVTELDHHANVDSWREMARDRNITVRKVRMIPETAQLDWEDLERSVGARTKLLAIGAASNALGTISDVRRAALIAHNVGALVYVDAVHYAPHTLIDVRALDCDFLACSAYKFNGPHVGVLYGREDLMGSLDFPRLLPAHHNAPERAESGTLNHEGIVGAGAAVEFFSSLTDTGGTRRERLERVFADLHTRGCVLVERLWKGLEVIPGVTLYGPPPGSTRTPTVGFTVDGRNSREVATSLAELAVFVSHGDFYAKTVVERLGLETTGLVRAGCGVYTTAAEVDRLLEGVSALSAGHD
jgi:cysteine desulfurase family protein (TIGR01976 family)